MRRTLKYHPLDVAQQCVAQKYGAEKYFSSNAPKRSRPRGILMVQTPFSQRRNRSW